MMQYPTADFVHPDLPDCEIFYFPQYLVPARADAYLRILKNTMAWRQDHIRIFGKSYPQPRLTALYGNNGLTYSYSGITMQPLAFTEPLREISQGLTDFTGVRFTTCLVNLYRDGNDSNGWHSDDERELGKNPVIASLSLGQARKFKLRHRRVKTLKYELELAHGSLLVMQGETQHHWLHQVPRTAKTVKERINLTFRVIK